MSAAIAPMPQMRTLSRESAEEVAIEVLAFVGEDEDRTRRFLRMSGLEPGSLREAARSPAFLLGVLDYLAGDEGTLRAYATKSSAHPELVMSARRALAPQRAAEDPEKPASSTIAIRCEHCDRTELRARRLVPHAPPNAVKVVVPRCGPCGGGFDQIETWLDARGREVG